jgi:hypothetical protein
MRTTAQEDVRVTVIAKSHHYNPQVYLKQFTNPDCKKELWQYDLTAGTAKKSAPKKAGCEDYYHSVDLKDGDRDDETLEKAFHPLENRLPGLFKAMREGMRNKKPLSDELWGVFFAFVTIQYSRCPKHVHALNEFLGDLHQTACKMIREHSSAFREKLSEQGIDPKEARKAEIEVRPARGSALLTSLDAMDSSLFSNMKWTLVCAPPGKFFFTSDAPVCCWAPPGSRGPFGTVGLADRDVEVTLPLSRRICAFGRWQPPLPELYCPLPGGLVDGINRRTVRNGWRFVFGPTRDAQILSVVAEVAEARTQRLPTD